jgi:hypothetical protein
MAHSPGPWDPRVRDVVNSVGESIQEMTKSSLVGLYVYGSLVAGDFDPEISDIDLIAVLSVDPVELAAALKTMHDALARKHPLWDGRIEVVYVTASHLRDCQSTTAAMAVASPGEPFHVVSGGPEWILTWYPARQEALSLVGPPIASIIPEIRESEFLDQVRERLRAFRTAIGDTDTRGSCAYAVITVCRGLYTLAYGTRPSKLQACAWAAEKFPRWKWLIESALAWRSEQWARPLADPAAVRETRLFVNDMIGGMDR